MVNKHPQYLFNTCWKACQADIKLSTKDRVYYYLLRTSAIGRKSAPKAYCSIMWLRCSIPIKLSNFRFFSYCILSCSLLQSLSECVLISSGDEFNLKQFKPRDNNVITSDIYLISWKFWTCHTSRLENVYSSKRLWIHDVYTVVIVYDLKLKFIKSIQRWTFLL